MKKIINNMRLKCKTKKQWQKDIQDTKNHILKQFKQDFKDFSGVEDRLRYFNIMYGIDIRLEMPKKIKLNKNWAKKFNF